MTDVRDFTHLDVPNGVASIEATGLPEIVEVAPTMEWIAESLAERLLEVLNHNDEDNLAGAEIIAALHERLEQAEARNAVVVAYNTRYANMIEDALAELESPSSLLTKDRLAAMLRSV